MPRGLATRRKSGPRTGGFFVDNVRTNEGEGCFRDSGKRLGRGSYSDFLRTG